MDKVRLIKCEDGKLRTIESHIEWIKNLVEVYNTEPEDLTESELKELQKCGYID